MPLTGALVRSGTRAAEASAIIPATLAHHAGPDHPPFFERVSSLLEVAEV